MNTPPRQIKKRGITDDLAPPPLPIKIKKLEPLERPRRRLFSIRRLSTLTGPNAIDNGVKNISIS